MSAEVKAHVENLLETGTVELSKEKYPSGPRKEKSLDRREKSLCSLF